MKGRLYYDNPRLRSFAASVIERGVEADGGPYVVLNETAFYPTGGGQPCDLGTLNGIEVVDVEEVDGQIRHRLARPLPADVSEVEGTIDWERRFDHMQQHAGQHILSAAFEHLYDVATVGFHMGRETVTIDLATSALEEEQADAAETLANRVVFENRDIDARFVDPAELASLPLRKPPTVRENIRIVTIRDFDYSPCGGTHPERTGEVGPIKILGWQRCKGQIRLEFVCGWRALNAMSQKQRILQAISRQLTVGEAELADQVARLASERKEAERLLAEAHGQLLSYEAERLLAESVLVSGMRVVAAAFHERPMPQLQRLAQQIASGDPAAVALLASGGTKTQVVFARRADVSVEMNRLLRETLAPVNGKGGGNPQIAQGGADGSVAPADVLGLARDKLEILWREQTA